MITKDNKFLIPKWLYYTSLLIFIAGMVQIFSGNLKWGIAPEQSVALVLTYTGIVIYFKKNCKEVNKSSRMDGWVFYTFAGLGLLDIVLFKFFGMTF